MSGVVNGTPETDQQHYLPGNICVRAVDSNVLQDACQIGAKIKLRHIIVEHLLQREGHVIVTVDDGVFLQHASNSVTYFLFLVMSSGYSESFSFELLKGLNTRHDLHGITI